MVRLGMGMLIVTLLPGCQDEPTHRRDRTERDPGAVEAPVLESPPEPAVSPLRQRAEEMWRELMALPRTRPEGTRATFFSPAHVVIVDPVARTATATDELRRPNPAALARLERVFRGAMPDDYALFLERCDGGSIGGPADVMSLFGAAEALEDVDAPVLPQYWGGVAIGTDGGGSMFVYGRGGVWIVPMGAPDTARVIAPTLVDAVRRVIDGSSFWPN